MQFPKVVAFIKSSVRNSWINDGDVEMYLRHSVRLSPPDYIKFVPFIDIANVITRQSRKGIFTELITQIETLPINIYVENVYNRHLYLFLIKRGYQDFAISSDRCVYSMESDRCLVTTK